MSSYPSETLKNIERFIREYDGTAIGQSVKNMLDNGASYETICEYADIEYCGGD